MPPATPLHLAPLSLPVDATSAAFHRAHARVCHCPKQQPSAAAQFIELVKAYQVLIDERRRAVYDQQMAIGRVPQPPRSTRPQQQAAGGSGAAAAAAAAAQQAQRPGRQAGPFGQVEDEAQLDEELRAAISKARGILSEAEEARFRARLATKNAEIVKSRTQTEVRGGGGR